ncbi:MAG: iron ABC transporter permease [Lachnospiraceae bacterium]|nr:iron ABC transporter permease [Lachnospiraceae bacterium]
MKNRIKEQNAFLLFFMLLAVLIAAIVAAVGIGSVSITPGVVVKSILFRNQDELSQNIILNMRLPRAVLAVMVGMSLGSAGALLQAVMKNPLADPGIIGVSSGASCVAVIVMLLFPAMSSYIPLFSFIGASFAVALVYLLSWKGGISPVRIVLSGVAVNAVFGAIVSILSILNSDKIQGVLVWLNGSLASKGWATVQSLIPYLVVGLILSLFCMSGCNTLQLGDANATSLGVNVTRVRVLVSLCAAFLAGMSVSFVGIIGFVGLVVPHITRMIVGSDYRKLLPCSMLLGGCVLLICDTLARTVFSPVELPVGSLMAIAGGPFFLYQLRKSRG